MATNIKVCGICSLRQITKRSRHWCPECEEAICDECKEHHKLLKVTRTHEPILISNYTSLPPFITDIQQSCVYHNEKYLQYCVEHALPICFKCITDHQKCTVIPLQDVTNNARTSEQFQDIETRLKDLLQNIDRIKKDRKANLASIQEMKKSHVAEIQQIRIQINKHLDKLEKQIIEDLEEKKCQCNQNIEKILSSVTEKETMITECQANVQSIKQYASDLQTFLGMREIDAKVNENEQYLQSLIEAESFDQLDLSCNIDTEVHGFLSSLKNFGSIEIKKRASIIGFSNTKDKQAQLQVTTATESIGNVELILQKKITTNGHTVRGCCMSMNGVFFFTEHYYKKMLLVISSSGTPKYELSLKHSDGFDVTFIDEKTVAITSGHSHEKTGIDIIDIEIQMNLEYIKLPGRSYGITRDHDSLFVCVKGFGIYKVNTLDYTTSLVIRYPSMSINSYVSVCTDKIYFTDRDSVFCYDRDGSRVWTFGNFSILKYLRGISADNDGNVYVVGKNSWNMVVISNDGKHHKKILTKGDGLCEPTAIFFDKQNRKLLVANSNDVAFLYNVT